MFHQRFGCRQQRGAAKLVAMAGGPWQKLMATKLAQPRTSAGNCPELLYLNVITVCVMSYSTIL